LVERTNLCFAEVRVFRGPVLRVRGNVEMHGFILVQFATAPRTQLTNGSKLFGALSGELHPGRREGRRMPQCILADLGDGISG